ncbi:MAG: hypothetical protein Q9167_000357 [Letrouitia subvulpina]
MDSRIQLELSKTDPAIPFRASGSYRHHTWAKTFHSLPELYLQPRSTDEIQKVVNIARKCRRRLVIVGCGHSPSDLTCTSSWMVNLDHYNELLNVDKESGCVVMQAGIRLYDLIARLKEHRLAMPNLGSIDNQSIAGALATATHGSSTRHGILSQSVLGLKIVLANGQMVSCAPKKNEDLFRAALVSLGALGIIIEVTFQTVPAFKLEWTQNLISIDNIMEQWDRSLWTQKEFTRIWWMPYMKSAIRWSANKTDKDLRPPPSNWWSGSMGYHTYNFLLYLAYWFPRILPSVEQFAMNVQYGFKNGVGPSAVEEGQSGLLMNCLFSQFVNEWAIPLEKGPEAITRLSAWFHGDQASSRIPFSAQGMYVHAPIEVRVSDTSYTVPRPYLDNTATEGPTLYLNATLYRPFGRDPPCRERYYQGFEWLMKELGGRPHWAKNFSTVSKQEFHTMYPYLKEWLRIRNEVDPEGMFVGDWHRRLLLPEDEGRGLFPLEEKKVMTKPAKAGGLDWTGYLPNSTWSPQSSEESFDLMHGSEAAKSSVLESKL